MTNTQQSLKKSDVTKARIVDVSMKLFLSQGFEATTMREIARAAGLAPGAAYYYFESKEHMIFDFYERSFQEHLPEAERVLREEKGTTKRLAGVINAHLKISEPYHDISKVLFKIAADPAHPLSPFGKESADLRNRNIALMGRVMEGERVDKDLASRLPELLWLFKMGMLLYWLHDPSPGHKKTYQLVDTASDLVVKLIKLAGMPGLKGMAHRVIKVIDEYSPIPK